MTDKCSSCGVIPPQDATVCPVCGAGLQPPSPPEPPDPKAVSAPKTADDTATPPGPNGPTARPGPHQPGLGPDANQPAAGYEVHDPSAQNAIGRSEHQRRDPWGLVRKVSLGVVSVCLVLLATLGGFALGSRGGSAEAIDLDGLLVSDDEGVHVVSTDGTERTTVIDRPVERVYDDGAGGLVYNERWQTSDGSEWAPLFTPPETLARATLWHLPSGASEPVALVESADPATRWTVVLAAGPLGDRRVAVVADMAFTPDATDEEQYRGDLAMIDLVSGDTSVLEEGIFGWESSAGPVSMADGVVAYEHGYSEPAWTLRSANGSRIPTACEADPTDEEGCAWTGALIDMSTLVGFLPSETAESVGLATWDLTSGTATPLPVDVAGYLVDWTGRLSIDAWDGLVIASFPAQPPAEQFPAVQVDITGGADSRELPIHGEVRILRAPLVRPAGSAAANTPGADSPSPPEEVAGGAAAPAGGEVESLGEYNHVIRTDHPTLGPVEVHTALETQGGPPGVARLTVTTADGRDLLSWTEEAMHWLAPATIPAFDEAPSVTNPVDSQGHIFLAWNPGRYPGVTVLVPTRDGYDDIGSLFSLDDTDLGRFYYAVPVDVDDDGLFEIEQFENDCVPDCAGGTTTSTILRWDGGDYTP